MECVVVPNEADTDSQEVRGLRALGQQAIERTLGARLAGKPVEERLRYIRAGIFQHVPNVKGDSPTEVRTCGVRSSGGFQYPGVPEMMERHLPRFFTLVDRLRDEVAAFPREWRDGPAERLASVVYSLCVLIHPYSDGNGQTARLLAMSYLQEFSSEHKKAILPTKPPPGTGPRFNVEWQEGIGRYSGETYTSEALEQLVRVQLMLDKCPTLPVEGELDSKVLAWRTKVWEYRPDLRDVAAPGDLLRQLYAEREGASRTLEAQVLEADPSAVPVPDWKGPATVDRVNAYLDFMLASDAAYRLHRSFVLRGIDKLMAEKSNEYLGVALSTYMQNTYALQEIVQTCSVIEDAKSRWAMYLHRLSNKATTRFGSLIAGGARAYGKGTTSEPTSRLSVSRPLS